MEEIQVVTAIHHPTRRRIVDHLILHEPARVGDMAAGLQLQVGSVSHHLRTLLKAGVVEQVPDPDGDGRTSWWQMARKQFSWAAEDFASPAEQVQAREAESASMRHQLQKLQQWEQRKRTDEPRWQRAGFRTDSLAWATPEELHELSGLLGETMRTWRRSIDADDGQDRRPVYVFAHGFPTKP